MIVVFGKTPENKEQLTECKNCKKYYPLNNFITNSTNNVHSTCKYCREEFRKESERRRIQKMVR